MINKNIPLSQSELTTLINESGTEFCTDPIKAVEVAFGPSGSTLVVCEENLWAIKRLAEMRGVPIPEGL